MASSSSTTRGYYDVFLSFRGEDTRDNFTSHLYDALCRNKIKTFIDNELERGEQITKALLKTIERSRISVIIFSKRYASSSWCVDELVKILECQRAHKQVVLPVFYHVDPSDVRKLRGGFGDAFAELERNFKGKMDKVPSWRRVLTEAANVSGWDSQVIKPDSKLVDVIVECVRKKLRHASPSNSEDLVGITEQLGEIKDLLRFPNLRILGLWGMGGVGKTTLAKEIFNDLSDEYEGSCFLSDIRRISEESEGPQRLMEKLYSSLTEEGILHFPIPGRVSDYIKDRLRSKRVLLVLDDVNDDRQVRDLIGRGEFFGPGSRILVTSRDLQVLRIVADQTYEIEELAYDDACQLFCSHAFRGNCPTKDFTKLSNRVVKYAQGNPLALRVLGSLLFAKTKEQWASQLHKLESFTPPAIEDVLKISFDALDDDMKNIFLDIACCFIGEHVHSVIRILDGCRFSTEIGISALADKCLITISDQKLGMHDLLQEMAYGIVRQNKLGMLGKYSRLWKAKDVYELLTENLGTEEVEAIFLDSSRIKPKAMELSPGAFERMHKLRLLKVLNSGGEKRCKVLLPHGLKYLSDKLRYLHWNNYPLPSLPSGFRATNLVELNLSFSEVRQLWEGHQNASNLKGINLSHCENLIALPDLSLAKGLERLNLECCTNLTEIPSSILSLDSLVDLDLRDCKNLRCLPDGISSLTTLKLSGCSNLTKCPVVSGSIEYLNLNETAIEALTFSVKDLGRLTALNLKECTKLVNLPDNIFLLNSLVLLDLSGCSNISRFPNVEQKQNIKYLYMRDTAVEELPPSICRLRMLVTLDLTNCKMLQNLPHSFRELRSLQKLILSGCSRITKFPEVSWGLKELYLDETAIEEVPSSIEKSPDLVELHLRNCKRFTVMTTSIGKMKSLRRLNLSGCSRFEIFPDISGPMKSLRYLYLDGSGIRNFPSPIKNLQWLSCLELGNCKNLVNQTKSALGIKYSANLPGSDLGLTYLRKLDLSGCSIRELPLCVSSMSSLEVLDLSGTNFKSLPISINELSELQYLSVKNCKELQSLPDLPPWLTTLEADNCTKLSVASSSSNLTEGNIFDFSFINCSKLDVNAQSTIMGLAWKKFQLYTRRLYRQVPSVPAGVSSFCFPGSKIPEWFGHQAWGDSITVRLPSHQFNRRLTGYSLCAVVAFKPFDGVSGSGFQIKCRYQFKDGKGVDCNFGSRYGLEWRELFDSVHLFFGFDPCLDVRPDCYSGKYRELSAQFSPEDTNDNPLDFAIVTMCAVRPVYAADEDQLIIHVSVPSPCSSDFRVIDKDPVGRRGFKEFFLSLEDSFYWLVDMLAINRFFCEEIMQMLSKMKLHCSKCYEEAEIGQSGCNVNSDMETDSNGSADEAEIGQSGSNVNSDMDTDSNGSDDEAETKQSGSGVNSVMETDSNDSDNGWRDLMDFPMDEQWYYESDFYLWEREWKREKKREREREWDRERAKWLLESLRCLIEEATSEGRVGAGRAAWEAETGQNGSDGNSDMERKIIGECQQMLMCLKDLFAEVTYAIEFGYTGFGRKPRKEVRHLVELINAFNEFWLGYRSCCGHQLEILVEARRILVHLCSIKLQSGGMVRRPFAIFNSGAWCSDTDEDEDEDEGGGGGTVGVTRKRMRVDRDRVRDGNRGMNKRHEKGKE